MRVSIEEELERAPGSLSMRPSPPFSKTCKHRCPTLPYPCNLRTFWSVDLRCLWPTEFVEFVDRRGQSDAYLHIFLFPRRKHLMRFYITFHGNHDIFIFGKFSTYSRYSCELEYSSLATPHDLHTCHRALACKILYFELYVNGNKRGKFLRVKNEISDVLPILLGTFFLAL